MYDLTFLRHGRSRADDENRCEGRYDSPLTDLGRAQARSTAKRLQSEGREFDAILCSPLSRALETATIAGEAYGLPITTEPLLMEHDNGIAAGMLRTELDEKYPLPSFDSPYRYFPERSGENAVMLHARAALALSAIVDRGPARYLVVSHGGILNAIARNILGIPPLVNVSGVVFGFGDNGYLHVKYYEEKHLWKIVGMVRQPEPTKEQQQ